MDIFYFMSIFLVFISGVIVGFSNKGITINHYNQQDEVPEDYNETLVDTLDPEVRRYYEQNHGMNKL